MQDKNKENSRISDRATAFGALAYLLAEAVYGEYHVEAEEGYAVYHVYIPVWSKLSPQSRQSLDKLIETAEKHRVSADTIYAKHIFWVPFR